MNFVKSLPADKVKVGSVFYVEGLGYAVVVMLTGKLMGKAYTAYKRPLVLIGNADGTEFKVYPQLQNADSVKDTVQVDNQCIGTVSINDDGDEYVYDAAGNFIGVLTTDGSNEIVVKDGEVVYKNVSRAREVSLGPVCEQLEFEDTNKVMSMDIEENWMDLLGEDAPWKLTQLLIDALSKQLHTSQLTREERKWGKAVVEFRAKQKPVRVAGKRFKPKASRFVCGYEKDGKRHLFFVKKITDVIYRVTQDITQEDAPYDIVECNDAELRKELQKAVREHLIPLAAYEFLFGKTSTRTVQVSGQISVDLHERVKWSGYSLPQVIQAGIQALEDGEGAKECRALDALPKVIKGQFFDETKHQMLRTLMLDEEF